MNTRGKRAELISFYCPYCNIVHVDYNFVKKGIYYIGDEIYCYKIEDWLNEEE